VVRRPGRRSALFSTFDLSVAVLGSTLALCTSLGDGPTVFGHPLGQLVLVAAIGCGALLGVRLLSWLLVDIAMVRRSGKEASSLVRLLTSWLLYLVAVMLLLKYGLGRDISALLTGSAVLGAVGGFALQATLDNLFSGVAIQLEQPFHLGDVVRVGDVVGRVEAMTWRAVHLRTEERSRVVVPNSNIGSDGVEVVAGELLTERTVEVEADPNAPPGRVIQLLTDAVSALPNVAARPAPEVYSVGLREWLGSRIYEVQYFPTDWLGFEPTESLIRRRCWYRLERHGLGASRRAGRLGTAAVDNPSGMTPDRIIAALSAVQILSVLGEEAIAELAEHAVPYLFTEDERVDDLPDVGPALFVVARGRLTALNPSLAPGELRQPTVPDVAKLEAWTAKELDDATLRLTAHLGPVAELMVRRAARRTVDVGRLYYLLSVEIDDLDRRAEFLRGVPNLATHELVPGDVFGVLSVFADANLRLELIHAATEVTLLRLPRDAVLQAIRSRPEAAERVLPALASWRAVHPAKRLVVLPPPKFLRALMTQPAEVAADL
jgi:small-conductance mechanosensitive channel/CRP-like cAMP-binding protein